MLVKELVELLRGMDQDAEVVVRDHSCDGDDSCPNSYPMMDAQEGFFDVETGNFVSTDEIDSDEEEVFGENAVAITFERVE